MYNLVYDINSYSKFIPLCISSEVHEEQDHKSRATMKSPRVKLALNLPTVNTMENGRSISINLEDGPFKSLKETAIYPQGRHECIISLHLEFEFSNKLLDVALVAYSNSFAIQWLNYFANSGYPL